MTDELNDAREALAECRNALDEQVTYVSRVWKALGIRTYEQAGGKEIDEIVREKVDYAEEARKLLRECKWELSNLTEKIGRKEPEGWEGSRRRHGLHQRLDAALSQSGHEIGHPSEEDKARALIVAHYEAEDLDDAAISKSAPLDEVVSGLLEDLRNAQANESPAPGPILSGCAVRAAAQMGHAVGQRNLPAGWAVRHYTGEEGACIKGPGVYQEIGGDREDAHALFWAIWDAAKGELEAERARSNALLGIARALRGEVLKSAPSSIWASESAWLDREECHSQVSKSDDPLTWDRAEVVTGRKRNGEPLADYPLPVPGEGICGACGGINYHIPGCAKS